jgi:hypothetical protein
MYRATAATNPLIVAIKIYARLVLVTIVHVYDCDAECQLAPRRPFHSRPDWEQIRRSIS